MTENGTERTALDGFIPLLTTLLTRRRLLLLLPAILFVLVVGVGLVWPRKWSATAAFTPQTDSNPLSRLAGLAAQFGVGLPANDQGLSPDFYAELIRSDQLLRALVNRIYEVRDGDQIRRGTLVDIYEIHQGTPALSQAAAVRVLQGVIQVNVGLRTGVVTVTATARQPDLALQLVQNTLSLVDEFNVESRQTEAGAERKFVEGRVQEAETLLREAEDRLQAFLSQNRQFGNSPQLQFTRDRLQRAVDARQQIHTTLLQALEQARIEEVRNTPLITIVERPALPALPDSRLLLLKGLLAVLIGLFIAAIIALAQEGAARARERDPDGMTRFHGLWRETVRDLFRPWRLLRRDPYRT